MYKFLLAGILSALIFAWACGGVSGKSTPNSPGQNPTPQSTEYLFVTHGTDTGISVFRVDANSGTLAEVSGSPFAVVSAAHRQAVCQSGGSCDSVPRPLAASPTGKFLYVIDPDKNGVRAFQINAATGALSSISNLAFDTGDGPQDIQVDPTGRFLYVDTISPQAIAAFAIDANSGGLQSVVNSPFGTSELPFLIAATNCCVYSSSTDQPGGVLAYRIDAGTGALSLINGSPFGAGQSTIAVAANASGDFVFAIDNTRNLLLTFRADSATGALSASGTPVKVGDNPVDMIVAQSGFVYVSTADGISGYALDATSGTLSVIPGMPMLTGAAMTADASGKFLFAVDASSNTIVTFSIGAGGVLTRVSATAAGTADYVNMAVAVASS